MVPVRKRGQKGSKYRKENNLTKISKALSSGAMKRC